MDSQPLDTQHLLVCPALHQLMAKYQDDHGNLLDKTSFIQEAEASSERLERCSVCCYSNVSAMKGKRRSEVRSEFMAARQQSALEEEQGGTK